MRLALIANPGSGTAPGVDELESLLSGGGADVTYVPIDEIADKDGGDLQAGALDALTGRGRPHRIVVAGGNGSIGPAALCAAQLGVPLAVVPAGTANDFAREGAAARARGGMRAGRLAEQDGVAHERAAVIEVETDGHAVFNVDGETCRCDSARFTLHPGGFQVVTPA